MIHSTDKILIADNDTTENLEAIKRFVRNHGFTSEDVKIIKRGGLLQLRSKRELNYG